MICGSPFLSKEDEARVDEIIKRFINETGKFFPVWLKSGKFTVDTDVVVQWLTPTSAVAQRRPQAIQAENFQAPSSSWPVHSGQPQGYHGNPTEWGMNRATNGQFNRQQPQGTIAIHLDTTIAGRSELIEGTVILKSKLRFGAISYNPLDHEIKYQGFKVPDYINENLRKQYSNASEAGVKIIKDNCGQLRYTVELRSNEDPKEEGIEIADNETLMVNTLVRYGKVSFEERDVQFCRQGWKIPSYIIESVKEKYKDTPKVDLFVISDDQGNLRYKVIIGKCNKAFGSVTKVYRKVTNYQT